MDAPRVNGKAIRHALEEKEMRVEELAAQLNKSMTFTRALLNGQGPKRNPNIVLKRLGKILDLEPAKLLVRGPRLKA